MAVGELERTKRSYTEEEIQRGLAAVARAAGNTRLAATMLEEDNTPIPRSTLQYWVTSRAEAYERVHHQLLPQIHERIAVDAEAQAHAAAQVEDQLLQHLQATVHDLKPAEAAGALRNVTTSKGINIDKARAGRNQPTSIIRTEMDAEFLLRALADLRPQHIDSTVEDEEAA